MTLTGKQLRTALLLITLLISSCANNSKENSTGNLLRRTPEAEGVDSRGIMAFLDAAEKSNHEFHSIMFIRHGKVVAEGWWSPYSPVLKHTLYSTSKSFTSTAVGFAVSEKRLKVTDKVTSFFPGMLPDTISPNLANMEVKDLLTMSAGQDPEPTSLIVPADSNWVKSFLARPVVNAPGTKFLYNSLATYMLSAIVQKVTGEKIIDYLTTRLFKPLGIEGMDWETDPKGINTGGWGLRLKTEDMARFGQMLLQKGKWNGKQIVPEEWINEATSFKIDQAPGLPDSLRKKDDWLQGYCYQFWRSTHNAFRCDGAFGQFIIVLPEKDAVIAITCESLNMQGELNLVWEYLLPSVKDAPLPENKSTADALKQRLATLTLTLPEKSKAEGIAPAVTGRTFKMDKNDWDIESMSFKFNDEDCHLTIKKSGKDFDFTLGNNNWIANQTSLPGPNLLFKAIGHFAGIPPVKVAAVYRWKEGNKLDLILRYIESPHTETLSCTFEGDKISVSRRFSFLNELITPDLKGHALK